MESGSLAPNFDDYEPDLETYVKDIQRQPLVDILVAVMLINDIFLFLREQQ